MGPLNKFVIFAVVLIAAFAVSPSFAQDNSSEETGFFYYFESPMNVSQELDAIRFLQARIVQDNRDGYYLVRNVRVLNPPNGSRASFAYLIAFQQSTSAGLIDLSDSYSVTGYFLAIINRIGNDFNVIDLINLTPPELKDRLDSSRLTISPEFTKIESEFNYRGPLFNATSQEYIQWQQDLANSEIPRWEFKDMNADEKLDCILDIEGFQFQPTSYYSVLLGTEDGFIVGFHSWGYDTDYGEIEEQHGRYAISSSKFSVSENGSWLMSWRDFYTWNGTRFVLSNEDFASEYERLITPLEMLASEAVDGEFEEGSRWASMPRYAVNATRYAEGSGTPFGYYYNLARIYEYLENSEEASNMWRTITAYINIEYDSQDSMGEIELASDIRDLVISYEEWRDEIYAAAESALGG